MFFKYFLVPIILAGVVIFFSSRGEIKGISGAAKVIDARTLAIKARRIQLDGIDAPDLKQSCGQEPKTWLCGREATAALSRLANNGRVTCTRTGGLEKNIILGRCQVFDNPNREGISQPKKEDGERKIIDINLRMVADGWALASGPGGQAYIDAEQAAQKAKKGLWRGPFVPPWEWRAAQKKR